MRCTIENCQNSNIDKHHVKTRGSGGSDDDSNILLLCRIHHSEAHQIGMVKLSKKYPEVNAWLEDNGWELTDTFGREKWGMG